jgi:hypothetical protein
MAEKYGGGAESYARFKQYDYRAVSAKHAQCYDQQVVLHVRKGPAPLLLLQSHVMHCMQKTQLHAGCSIW